MFYCKNERCRISICSHCAIKDHRNHDWEELDAFYNKRKDLFLSRLSTAKNKVESAEKVKSLFNNDRDKVARNLGLTIEKIDQKKQEGIEFFNQESERICQTYKNTAAKLTEDFDMELRDIETYIENSNECCLISEQLLKENKAKFLSVEKTISDKLEIFGSKSFEHKKGDVNINLPLIEKNYENLATKVAELQRDLFANSTIMHQLSVIGVDERGNPIIGLKKIQSAYEKSVSMIVLLLKIITFLVAILFIARECYVWWNLSLCDMELCDIKALSLLIQQTIRHFAALWTEE